MTETEVLSSRRPILVVEDDEDTVAALRYLLDSEGYPSVSAPDVANAIASLSTHEPGLMLLDWSLDDGSGEAVLVAMRTSGAHTPVVLMTGNSSVSKRSSPDVTAVLKKPFGANELLDVVARYYQP